MFTRVFILFCFSLIFISTSYSQLPNKVKVVVKNDASEDLRYKCGTYDENTKELKLNLEMSKPLHGFAFILVDPDTTTTEDWIVPLQMSGIAMDEVTQINQVEFVLNLETDLILPDGIYEIHVLPRIYIPNVTPILSDETLIFLFNKQSD